MSSATPDHITHPSATQMIYRHADWLAVLPQHDDFPRERVPEEYHAAFEKLRRTPIVEVVGQEQNPARNNRFRKRYVIADWAREMVVDTLAERDTICPCGHSGLRNRGDHYRCSFECCDREFSRDQLEVDQ